MGVCVAVVYATFACVVVDVVVGVVVRVGVDAVVDVLVGVVDVADVVVVDRDVFFLVLLLVWSELFVLL